MYSRSMVRTAVALAVLLAAVAPGAVATVPNVMNFQGRLTDDLGNPLTGIFDLTFNLYNVAVGGSSLWTEVHPNVSVSGGLFNILLGESSTLTDAQFDSEERYLGITVEADPEQSPRIQLTTVAFAHRVSTVDGAAGGTVTGDLLLESTADVNAMEITQGGLGRGLRIAMNNGLSTESGLVIASQNSGSAIGIAADGGGPAITVVGAFGDASIDFPAQSISGYEITDSTVTSGDITNEAGAAQTVHTDQIPINGTYESVGSVTFIAPSQGYILIQATAEATCTHITGTLDAIEFGISAGTPNSLPPDQERQWWLPSALPSATYKNILTAQKILPVFPVLPTDYHVSARNAAGNGVKSLINITVSAIFIPTVYGEFQEF